MGQDEESQAEQLREYNERILTPGKKFFSEVSRSGGRTREMEATFGGYSTDSNGGLAVHFLESVKGMVAPHVRPIQELAPTAKTAEGKPMFFGLKVPRSDGSVDSGWTYAGTAQDRGDGVNRAVVQKREMAPGTDEPRLLTKEVPIQKLIDLNVEKSPN